MNHLVRWLVELCKKIDIKKVSHIDTSSFAVKSNLASLETEVGKFEMDKLVSVPVPINLSKLSDVVKNNVTKKW